MTNEDASFDILLDKQEGIEVVQGLISGGFELRGRRFPTRINNGEGVADSVQAVQNSRMRQVPSYALVNGRGYASKEDQVWQWSHTLGERIVLDIPTGRYTGVQGGKYVADIQNGGLFMPCPADIRAAVIEQRLVNNAFPIDEKRKDMLFGENCLYQFDGKEVVKVPAQIFNSYDAFEEVAATAQFQESLREMSAVYVVLRTVEQAQANPSGYRSIDEQLKNPDIAIVSGGRAQAQKMLEQARSFKWKEFGSHHDGYQTSDTGCVVVLYDDSDGVNCYDYLNDNGRSIGVAPEALKARSAGQKTSLDIQVDSALRAERPFEYNGKLWAPLATGIRVYK